mgnify:CR=1 FL=1
MKINRKALGLCAALIVVIGFFYVFWLSPRYEAPILMYHRFGYGEGSLFVTPENFERQMSYLKRRNYNVVSLRELVERIRVHEGFAPRTVAITIDDGYRDNYTYAYMALKKNNFPATIFLAVNSVGNDKDFITWAEARDLLKDNIALGSHTRNHAYLPSITSDAVLADEIAGSKKIIEKNTGVPAPHLCYPTGGFTEKVKHMAREAGYEAAFTTNRGMRGSYQDLYELKRIKVTNSDTNKPLSFWAKLSGYYNIFRSQRSGY